MTKHKTCRQKVRYETAKAARFFANCDGLAPYKCPDCGGWHLTSDLPQVRKHRGGRRRA